MTNENVALLVALLAIACNQITPNSNTAREIQSLYEMSREIVFHQHQLVIHRYENSEVICYAQAEAALQCKWKVKDK